jgi:hypothetical protein
MSDRSLPIPPGTTTDPKAVELLRAWAAHGRQHVSIATNVWKDPGNWGIMLVDLAKHVASAYEQSTGADRTVTLARIRELFDAEWDRPTDEPTGELLK